MTTTLEPVIADAPAEDDGEVTTRYWIDDQANIIRQDTVPRIDCPICGTPATAKAIHPWAEGWWHPPTQCMRPTDGMLDEILRRTR